MIFIFLNPAVAAAVAQDLTCPLNKENLPFDRPAVSLATKFDKVCPTWRKGVCCSDLSLAKISMLVDEARNSAEKCSGCLENLEALLCGAACSPVLLDLEISSPVVQVSPVFCAAAQLSCGGAPQCIPDSFFTEKLKSFSGKESSINFQVTDSPRESLLPVSAECGAALATPIAVKAPEKSSWRLLQFFALVLVCAGFWLSARLRKKKQVITNFQEWASLDIGSGDSRRL